MKVSNLFKSRTVWTILVTFVIGGTNSVVEFIPADWLPLVTGILSILAIYFRVNTKQD